MADDLIASARSMTVVSDGQYNAIGLPKGGLTPATITAMTGFSLGEGLAKNWKVEAAISILQSLDVSDPNYSNALAAASRLEALSDKIMDGGPTVFMQRFNAARGHIGDSIELTKVTEFCKNQDLSKFGTGMNNMSDLTTNGIAGKLGDLNSVGAAFTSSGKLFNTTDMANFGTPQGLYNQISDNKMANATGLNDILSKNGIPSTGLNDPAVQEQVRNSFAGIKDDKQIAALGEQLEVANPFAGLPGVTGSTSITENNAGRLLGGGPPPTPTSPQPEMNVSPNIWSGVNSQQNFGVGPKKISGYSAENPTSFGSASTKGQKGTGVEGLKGTPFESFLGGGSGQVSSGDLNSYVTGGLGSQGAQDDMDKANEFLQGGGLDAAFGKLNSGGR